jgi:hypothetical protein
VSDGGLRRYRFRPAAPKLRRTRRSACPQLIPFAAAS